MLAKERIVDIFLLKCIIYMQKTTCMQTSYIIIIATVIVAGVACSITDLKRMRTLLKKLMPAKEKKWYYWAFLLLWVVPYLYVLISMALLMAVVYTGFTIWCILVYAIPDAIQDWWHGRTSTYL